MIDSNATLEEMLVSLDACVKELEKDDISLEDSFRTYEKGMQLVGACNATIDRVKKDVLKIDESGNATVFDGAEE